MKLNEFINIIEGRLINRPVNFKYNISIDTRTIKENDIYIPICFKEGNGNNFIKEAVIKKAGIVLIPKSYLDSNDILFDLLRINVDIGIVEIDSGLEVLKRLAINKRNNYKGKVIAITGSNGKTSTKELLHLILSSKYNVFKSKENYNNILGLCMMILELKDEEIAIFELGMNHLNEISEMSKIVKPDIGLITNIGTAHIGNLLTKENILKAKLEIIDGFNDKSILFINNDLIFKDVDYKNIYRYEYLKGNIDSDSIIIYIDNDKVELNLKGQHNIYNVSSAYYISKYLDIDKDTFIKIIKKYKSIRMKEYIINNTLVIDDSYNANYDSMINGIDYINITKYKNKILVLGDMLELGEDEIEIHKDLGKYIRKTNINKVYTYGNLSKYIGSACNKISFHYEDMNCLIKNIKNELNSDTIIYIKGSHSMKMEKIIERLR